MRSRTEMSTVGFCSLSSCVLLSCHSIFCFQNIFQALIYCHALFLSGELLANMTRRRQRARSKSKLTVDLLAFPTDSAKEEHEEKQIADSGNDSPQSGAAGEWQDEVMAYHRSESIKAWVRAMSV